MYTYTWWVIEMERHEVKWESGHYRSGFNAWEYGLRCWESMSRHAELKRSIFGRLRSFFLPSCSFVQRKTFHHPKIWMRLLCLTTCSGSKQIAFWNFYAYPFEFQSSSVLGTCTTGTPLPLSLFKLHFPAQKYGYLLRIGRCGLAYWFSIDKFEIFYNIKKFSKKVIIEWRRKSAKPPAISITDRWLAKCCIYVTYVCLCMCAHRGGREGHMTGWHATVYRALIRRVS